MSAVPTLPAPPSRSTELSTALLELPPLRLLPAPPCEPPYDDELGLPAVQVVPMVIRPSLHLLPVGPAPARDEEAAPLPVRTALDELPAARTHARTLVQGLLEVLAGLRPLTQLRRELSFALYEELEQSLTEQAATARSRQAGPRPDARSVRSLHVQARPEGVAEVCATVRRGARTVALALRLEGVQGSWQCTALSGV